MVKPETPNTPHLSSVPDKMCLCMSIKMVKTTTGGTKTECEQN